MHSPGPAGAARRTDVGAVSRRAVLGAAWGAPVIVVAAAAPASAASPFGTLRFEFLNGFGANFVAGRPTSLESQTSIQNVWGATSTNLTTLTAKLSYPDTRVAGVAPSSVTGAGWAFVSAAHVGSTWVYTFTFTGVVAPSGSTSMLDVIIPLSNNAAGTFSIGATATSPGFTGAAITSSVTI